MIVTNDLDEFALLNMLKSCCKNRSCECDEKCPLNAICLYSNLNLSQLKIDYVPGMKVQEKGGNDALD